LQRPAASITLGPYQFHERVGEGGSGQVYRATGPTGTVAVKILGPSGELDDASRARFAREIAALQQLAHPNLVALLDHGIDDELGPYLVLPMLPGAHLRTAIAGRALCPEAAILLARPIVAAIAALHAANYIHRDLKPENAVASPAGAITVIDLGLAWRDGMTRHTESGAAVGSVGYMAPEQIDGRPVAASADVFALGVMIYEWIAGKRPFQRGRPAEEAAAALIGTFAPLSAADRRCDEELAQLVGRCLAMDPAKRPTTLELGAALDALTDWIDPTDVAATDAERAAILADPVAYQIKIAPFRVRRAERRAREALDAGKPFVALAHADRGLAYLPDHPPLLALVAEAESSTSGADAVALPVPVPVAAKPRRWLPVALGAVAIAGVAVAITIAATSRSAAPAASTAAPTGDPWGNQLPTGSNPSSIVKVPDKEDKATIGAMVGLMGRAFDKVDQIEDGKTRDKCIALAEKGDADATDTCDAALKAHPDDPTARAARAIAHLRAARVDAALADIDRAIAIRDDARWHRIRAAARQMKGDRAGATADLVKACELGDTVACRDVENRSP